MVARMSSKEDAVHLDFKGEMFIIDHWFGPQNGALGNERF